MKRNASSILPGICRLVIVLISGCLMLPIASARASCLVAPAGLVSWWRGESNMLDSWGHNDAPLPAGLNFAPGKVGLAPTFADVTNVAVVPYSSDFAVDRMSIEAWVSVWGTPPFPYDGFSYNYHVICGQPNGMGELAIITKSDGWTHFGYAWGGVPIDPFRPHILSTSHVDTFQQYHVVVTWGDGTVKLYVNGQLQGELYAGGLSPSTGPFYIGGDPDTFLHGAADEVSFYNRVLTTNEIQALYNAGSAGKCLPTPPVITGQPVSQEANQGDTVYFEVTAQGTMPMSYQWRFDGTNIAGATNASLTLTNVQPDQSGIYSVVVTNRFGSDTSDDAVLEVHPLQPCITAPSGLVALWRGDGDTTDSVGANNGSWYCEMSSYASGKVHQAFDLGYNALFVEIPSSPELSTTNFTVEVWVKPAEQPWGEYGTVYSIADSSYVLAVQQGTVGVVATVVFVTDHSYKITSSTELPLNQFSHLASTWDGSTMRLYVNGALSAEQAAGSTPAISNGLSVIGGTYVPMLPVGAIPDYFFGGLIDEVSYYNRALSGSEVADVFAADNGGKCVSPIPPTIVYQPEDATVAQGSTATFTVGVTGTAPISYQWRRNGEDLSGATNGTLTLANVQTTQAGDYSVMVSNYLDSVTSSNALLTVFIPVSILAQPTNLTVIEGQDATFSVTADGTAPLSYQWRYNGANIAGATNSALILTGVQTSQAGDYSVVVGNSWNSVTSAVAQLTVFASQVTIVTPPADVVVAEGEDAVFSVTADGVPPLYYQWSFNNVEIPGAAGSSLSLAQVQVPQSGTYSVVVSNLSSMAAGSAQLKVYLTNACYPQPASLVGWWRAEGDATDSVGTNNGTLLSDTGFAAGKVGQAFSLTIDTQTVRIPSSPSLQPDTCSIEAWINPAAKPANAENQGMVFGSVYGKPTLYVRGGSNGVYAVLIFATIFHNWEVVSSNQIPLNQFSHLAGTWDGTTLKIYVNGQLQGANAPGAVPTTTTNSFYMGGIYNGSGRTTSMFFNGLIDEVSLYNVALSASDIKLLYGANSIGKCPGEPTPAAVSDVIRGVDGSVRLNFVGTTIYAYRIQYTDSLTDPVWHDLGARVPDESGLYQFIDNPPADAPMRFYRAVWP